MIIFPKRFVLCSVLKQDEGRKQHVEFKKAYELLP